MTDKSALILSLAWRLDRLLIEMQEIKTLLDRLLRDVRMTEAERRAMLEAEGRFY